MKVPQHIIDAVNALLAPYGEKYTTAADVLSTVAGYKSRRDARAFLGCSQSTLTRLVRAGALRPIKLTGGSRTSKVVFSVAELESYVRRCRDFDLLRNAKR